MRGRLAAVVLLVGLAAPYAVVSAQQTQETFHDHIQDFAFVPEELTIEAGDSVEWDNHDDATHTATAFDGSFDSGNLENGEAFTTTIDKPGIIEYECSIHHFEGVLIVEDPDGDNLPDLFVSELDAEESLFSPDDKDITVTVKNNGLGTAPPAEVRVVASWDDGQEVVDTYETPALDPLDTHTQQVTWNTTGKVGEFNVTATVDPGDAIDEPDEDDNDATTQTWVLAPVVPGQDVSP